MKHKRLSPREDLRQIKPTDPPAQHTQFNLNLDVIESELPGLDVSHELRTSLAVITMLSGNLELLYDRLDDCRKQSMIRDLRGQTKKLNTLVGSILRVSLDDQPVCL